MKKTKQGKMQVISKIADEKELKVKDFTNKKIEQALEKVLVDLKEKFEEEKKSLEQNFEELEIKLNQREDYQSLLVQLETDYANRLKEHMAAVNKEYKKLIKEQGRELIKHSKELQKAKESLNNLIDRDIASYKKEDLYSDVINEFFDDITSTLLKGEEIVIEVTGFGTFELKKHSRFGGMYVKFNVSQNIKNKLKELNQKNMSIDHIIDYTKQKGMIKKAYQKSDRYIKGKTNKKEDEE